MDCQGAMLSSLRVEGLSYSDSLTVIDLRVPVQKAFDRKVVGSVRRLRFAFGATGRAQRPGQPAGGPLK